MSEKKNSLIVDAGNTHVKLAHFQDEILVKVIRYESDENEKFISDVNDFKAKEIFVCSVLSESDNQKWFSSLNAKYFSHASKLPLSIDYETPTTLGLDRLANAVAAVKSAEGNRLVIDLGTCIKFDVIDKKDRYLGGSISPGLNMRFQALNHYTGKLPKVEPSTSEDFIGKNTQASIRNGVQQGIQGEINHLIGRYEKEFMGLTIFVTGGDAKFFDFPQKSNIFALENLTLKGLFYIYKLND